MNDEVQSRPRAFEILVENQKGGLARADADNFSPGKNTVRITPEGNGKD